MENDEKKNSGIDNIMKATNTYKEAKNVAAEAGKLAASVQSGNIVQAAKSAAELSKSKIAKKSIKRKLMMIGTYAIVLLLIITTIVGVFNAVKEKVLELLSSLGKGLRTFWKWIADDYWLKLDEDIEYTDIDDTRSGS